MPAPPCRTITRRLSAFADGELPASAGAEVEAHLASCASCAAELRRIYGLDAGLKRLPGAEPSAFFTARVAAAARAPGEYRGPLRRFLRFPVPAAAALTAFIFFNMATFAFDINAMENGPRLEIAGMVLSRLTKPDTLINPVAVARLCGECSAYMCRCMHEAGRQNSCPCPRCRMPREAAANRNGPAEKARPADITDTEGQHVR